MDRDAAGTYETQFVSQSDDGDTLYNVEKILDEKGRKYKVQWEGIDPATGKKWKPDWVWKTDCTDDLIADWKKQKEERKRRATSNKSSSSASGSVASRAPAAKPTATTSKKPKPRLPAARPSPPVSEARSNSSAHTRTSAPDKRSSKFVVEVPARAGTKRPREPEVTAAPLSPVKRLRLNGPASPLPASPFDDDDGATTGKKRAGPVTYKKRKPVISKSPLARKTTSLLASKTNKVSSRNMAGSSRAKPLFLSSPENATRERAATSRANTKHDSATEDEDSDPQLPDRLRPSRPGSSKAPTTIRPATRSRRPSSPAPKPSSPGSDDPNPETFVRPHPTSSARTRPLPPRDPVVNRANLRDVRRSMRGDIPRRIRESISAQNRFPQVVTNDREMPLGGTKPAEPVGAAPGRNDAEAERSFNPPSPPRSMSGSTSAKLVSFRIDEVGDRDEFGPGGGGEQVMSSIESENAPVLSPQAAPRSSPRRSNGDATALQQTGSQPHSQSQGNSSKGTVVPDSQAQAQNSNNPAKSPPPAKPHAATATSPSPARVALTKSGLSTSRTQPKLRPSEMLRLGKGIIIKPRPSVAETESTLIESIPPELAAAHAPPVSGSEYEPQESGSQSETTESNEMAPVASGSGEETETKSEKQEIDSTTDDDDEEIVGDGPSFRTRSQSSQSRPKYQALWPDSSPTRPKRQEPKGEEQVGALSPRENEEDLEEDEEQGPIPTSSPSLGGGRVGSVDLDGPESPIRRRMTMEVVLPPPSRSSQRSLSQVTRAAGPSQEEPVKQQEPVTQETTLEAEDEGAQVQLDESGGLENDQEGSPPLNDQDQSFAHAMEIDELLTDEASHPSVEDDMKLAAATEGDPKHADTTGSVIDLSNTTTDTSQSIMDLDLDATHTDNFMDHIQPVAEPAPALPSQPDSQIPTSSSSFPQAPKATAPIPPAFLLPLSESSQSQCLPATQDPVPGSQNLASQPQLQPQSQPPSQPQERTHSSIEEPSSWSFPPPGQVLPPADTISSFTPTNPSVREPRTSGEHLPPSSNPFAPTTNGDNYGLGLPHTQSTELGLPSTFGPVPELSTEVFRRGRSPGSDIDQFDSPMKATPTFLREGSTTSPESRKTQDAVLGIRFGRADAGQVDSSWQSEKQRMAEALKEAESKLAARDHRIVELTAELEQLAAEKSRAAAIFRDNMAQSETIVQQQQEAYTTELADHAKTIADLQLQLMAARSQSEIAESQRVAALEQYTIASDEAKSLADANRALNDRVRLLEKQVTTGLLHWQRGFESNMERKEQELKQLQAQLDLEREIRARTDGRDIRRRAAEWYELKKRVEDLEAESLQVEQEAKELRKREKGLHLREQELVQREKALENLPVPPSQSQGDRGLSQDDMQTETMLSDRSAVLADLDGPAGEDMVWMCTYRGTSDRLCGEAFDTMGRLLTHVLDANGHKVDTGCHCG